MKPLAAIRTRPEPEPTPSLRVLVVDDDMLYAEALATLLRLNPRVEVVGIAGDGTEGVEQALALEPDVVLMDIQMPRLDGIAATRRIRRRLPRTRVLMMTALTGDEYLERAVKAGAEACIRKFGHGGDLLSEIDRLAAG